MIRIRRLEIQNLLGKSTTLDVGVEWHERYQDDEQLVSMDGSIEKQPLNMNVGSQNNIDREPNAVDNGLSLREWEALSCI
jgi:hypothetical protein